MLPLGPLLVVLAAPATPAGLAFHRLSAPPVIDGDLSEWTLAPLPLTQQTPAEGAAPRFETRAAFGYDDGTLYVALEVDSPVVTERLTRRDRDVGADAVSLELDTRGDRQSAWVFEVSSAGVQRDGLRTGDESRDWEWDALWRSQVRRTPRGWAAELAIPLSMLRFERGAEGRWGVQVRRFTADGNELDLLGFIPRAEHGELLRFVPVTGVEALSPRPAVVVQPFLLSQFRFRGLPGELGASPDPELAFRGGGNARVGLTSGLVLDATVLPDFGQLEADQVVLNLTTYEVEFPERRPFFKEGANLASLQDASGEPLGTQLFYSRRIGLTPPEPRLADGDVLEAMPSQARIWGAAKLTGLVTRDVSVSAMDAVTAAEQAVVSNAGARRLVEVSPLSNFAALRVQVRPGSQWALGVSLTDVHRFEDAARAQPGCGGRCFRDASTAGLDATFSTQNGEWIGAAALLGSHQWAGPARVIPDGTAIAAGDSGLGGRLELSRAAGRFLADAIFETASPKLDLNEVGYLRSQNYHRWYVRAAWHETDAGPFRSSTVGVELYRRQTWRGVVFAEGLNLNHLATWKNEWTSWLELQLIPVTQDPRELRDGAAMERPAQLGVEAALSSNPSKPVSFHLDGLGLTTWRGGSLDATAELLAHPTAALELAVGPTLKRVWGDPRWVAAADGQGGYHFGLQDALAVGATVRLAWTFSPAVSVQGYLQAFWASVRWPAAYDAVAVNGVVPLSGLVPVGSAPPAEDEAVVNANLVLRWEYLPGSTLFLVYAHNRAGLPLAGERPRMDFAALGHAATEDVVMVKLGYSWAR